jgi:hypothetical protein
MAKKKKSKKKDKKIAAKVKGIKKEKALNVKLKDKSKKEKAKAKKDKTKRKKSETGAWSEISKGKRGTRDSAVSETKTSGTSSLSVNARTAISNIKNLGTTEAVNNYITGDERVTVLKAAKSRNTSFLPE